MSLQVKRVYDPPATDDGVRVLVDRLWPRGLTKAAAQLDCWLREIAPSHALRRWSAHDPAKWPEFRRRYRRELDRNGAVVATLAALAAKKPVTLLFAARDTARNNAVALQAYLGRSAGGGASSRRSKTSRASEGRSG
jgi:uncharacterized protein YeaO (DUF488 family)